MDLKDIEIGFDKALAEVASAHVTNKTKQWKGRGNPSGHVRSDIATCTRQAYYNANLRHLLPHSTGEDLDDRLTRTFLGGHIIDDWSRAVVEHMADKSGCEVLRTQYLWPIRMAYPLPKEMEDYSFAVTTDYVLALDLEALDGTRTIARQIGGVHGYKSDGNGGRVKPSQEELTSLFQGTHGFIPFEIKSTSKETKTWFPLAYLPQNLKQVLYWVYYAKACGLYVPCACLVYVQRGTLASKQVVISVDEPHKNLPKTKAVRLKYADWEPIIDSQFKDLTEALLDNQLPNIPKVVSSKKNPVLHTDLKLPATQVDTIPDYICKSCVYNVYCAQNMDVDNIKGYLPDGE